MVNPLFDSFWDEYGSEANLQLFLPEVVIGELLFQQTTSALKTLSKANDSFKRLSSITGKAYSHRVDENRVKKEIKSRFYIWAKAKKFHEFKTPIDNVDWKSIIDSSIWRKDTFLFDPQKADLEKGFRDSLILETVAAYCENKTGTKIVFITNDQLLKDVTENRLKHYDSFTVFESLNDFETYLRLEKENLEQSFIKSVINKAKKKFFKYKDETSLVYKIDLIGILDKQYGDKFNDPAKFLSEDFEDGFYLKDSWKSVSNGIYEIGSRPQFQSIEGENTFIWLSKVRYHKDYENEPEFDSDTYIFTHEIFFDVYWKVNISVKERFTKMEFIKVDYQDSKFIQRND